MSSVYKSICIKRLCYIIYSSGERSSPLYEIVKICQEYGLFECLKCAIESGDYMSKVEWKTNVKYYVNELDYKRTRIKCLMYSTLNFLDFNYMKPSVWWVHSSMDNKFTKQNVCIVKLLLCVSRYQQKTCILCNNYLLNDATHILFVCDAVSDTRLRLLQVIEKEAPRNIVNSMKNMSLEEKTKFILNGFYCDYVMEWRGLYDAVSNFVYSIMKQYEFITN